MASTTTGTLKHRQHFARNIWRSGRQRQQGLIDAIAKLCGQHLRFERGNEHTQKYREARTAACECVKNSNWIISSCLPSIRLSCSSCGFFPAKALAETMSSQMLDSVRTTLPERDELIETKHISVIKLPTDATLKGNKFIIRFFEISK